MKTRLLFGLYLASVANADVRLPALMSDHMVLQRGVHVRIWGWADPAEPVAVRFQNQKAAATTDQSGKWQAFLKPLAQGEAADLSVAGKNPLTVHDVLVGEVWV